MNEELFDISKFNIIQDEENYYFFRALNMADNSDIEQGIIASQNNQIERIRTDRERYEGETKYKDDSQISLEEVYDHIKMHYRKDTNCISLTSNGNIAINYGRGSYKDKYIMVKIPKREFGEKVVTAGQYMVNELYLKIMEAVEKLPEETKGKILETFDNIDKATKSNELRDIIEKRYTANPENTSVRKAHPRKGISYRSPKSRISSYQSLYEEQLLEVNKVYAKLQILENKDILKHVIEHSSNSKLRETIGNAFSSAELIHYGEIDKENIIEVSKEAIDIFALIQQVDGIDKKELEELKQILILELQNGSKIPEITGVQGTPEESISIDEMYELTEGKVEYGKADSIVKNMFYLSKARKNAIELANILEEVLGDNSGFEDIINYIRENGFRVEPEIISRQSGKGVKLSEAVNLNLQKEEQGLVDEIKGLSEEELEKVLQNGGLYNTNDIITRTFSSVKENKKIDKSKYYAEAIISKYNFEEIGIEEFKIQEKNELIKRLQERNVVLIYEKLKELGIEENNIPKALLNIVMREGFYEQYENGNLEELVNTRQDVLLNDINIEVVERFLGYYDIENTGIRLKDYQQRANENVNEIFESKRFAQVILPTGAGKSFVALVQMQKYVEKHPNEKMLYLAPQDEILNQIKNYIIKYLHGKQETIGKTEDEIIKEVFPNITFETYSGLLAKRGKELIKDKYGMIVLDELHRTGAKEWEEKINSLLENQGENVKVLGITATPTRDVDGRDMANETAKKLGYTDEEIAKRKHLASNMTLENAIRMGYVVNPKLVYCKYDLISSGKMDELKAKIDAIEDETKRIEELQKYNELREKLNKEVDSEIGEEARKKLEEDARKNLDSGIGKEKILRENVKKGGKYIVFIPVTDQGDIEDEDGNRIGTKTGEDKIKAYQEYLNKVFEGTDIFPKLHSMLGSYSKDKNKEELEVFETDNSEDTKFMVVMNKANEGLHIDGVDGIIWFRALDENSRILYLQQLGRSIYAIDEDIPLPEEKRPIVIDLANNSLTVKIEKDFENSDTLDDLEILIIVVEWINAHNGMFPDRNSSNKQEQHYYAILRKIQEKYSKYLDGFEEFEDLEEDEISRIEDIIELATEIDLWNMELPPIPKTRGTKEKFDPFTVEGVLKDFVEFEDEVDGIERKSPYEEIIEWLETHNGEMPRSGNSKYETNLYARWNRSDEYKLLKEYSGRPIEEVPEEYREKIDKLRGYGFGQEEKTAYEEIIEWLETHNGEMPSFSKNKDEKNLYQRWWYSNEYKILKEYAGREIEEVPEEYREKIDKLRGYGLGKDRKIPYEEIIEWLETHNGEMPRSGNSKYEKNLYQRWLGSNECKILKEYAGREIEEVPEEYREKVLKLRSYGLEKDRKISYEEIIEWLETHNGEMPRSRNSKYEDNLYQRWVRSNEYKILKEYTGRPIEEIPEKYRDKIAKLREYFEEKSTYEEIIEWLETHEGKIPRSGITRNGKRIYKGEMTKEELNERNLNARWSRSDEYKVLQEYAGRPVEEVPDEYREKIARLRSYGLGQKPRKLQQAKQARDEAKTKNEGAKKLEQEVLEELAKKRGKNLDEQ